MMEGVRDDQLLRFLAENRLDHYLSKFQHEQVDFETLMLLTESDLKSLDLPMGAYLKLKLAIQKKKTDFQRKCDGTKEGGSDRSHRGPRTESSVELHRKSSSQHNMIRSSRKQSKSPLRRTRSPRSRNHSRSPHWTHRNSSRDRTQEKSRHYSSSTRDNRSWGKNRDGVPEVVGRYSNSLSWNAFQDINRDEIPETVQPHYNPINRNVNMDRQLEEIEYHIKSIHRDRSSDITEYKPPDQNTPQSRNVDVSYYESSYWRDTSSDVSRDRFPEEIGRNINPTSRNEFSDTFEHRQAEVYESKLSSIYNTSWERSANCLPGENVNPGIATWRNTSMNISRDESRQEVGRYFNPSTCSDSWNINNANPGIDWKHLPQPEMHRYPTGVSSKNTWRANPEEEKLMTASEAREVMMKARRAIKAAVSLESIRWAESALSTARRAKKRLRKISREAQLAKVRQSQHANGYLQRDNVEPIANSSCNINWKNDTSNIKSVTGQARPKSSFKNTALPERKKVGGTKKMDREDRNQMRALMCREYAILAENLSHLKVAIIDNSTKKITKNNEFMLKKILVKEVNKLVSAPDVNKEMLPTFILWTYTGTHIKLTCKNDRTLKWLTETLRNRKPWPGAELAVVQADMVPTITGDCVRKPISVESDDWEKEMVNRSLGAYPTSLDVSWDRPSEEDYVVPKPGVLALLGLGLRKKIPWFRTNKARTNWSAKTRKEKRERLLEENEALVESIKHFRVAIIDYPYQKITKAQEVVIKKFLMEKLNEAILTPTTSGGDPLAFLLWTHIQDMIRVVCKNEATLNWLTETVRNCKPWDGANLTVVPLNSLPVLNSVCLFIPVDAECDYEPKDIIIRRLAEQNPTVSVAKWNVFHKVKQNPRGHMFIFNVADDDMKILNEGSLRMNYLSESFVLDIMNRRESKPKGKKGRTK